MADLEQLYSALEKADAAGATKDAQEIAAMIREQQSQPQDTSGGIAALGHGVLRGALPAAAGIITGAAGATAGLPLGPVGAIGGGLTAGFAGSAAAAAAQEKFLEANPNFAKTLGLDPVTAAREAKLHPYASMAGEIAPNLLAFRPSGAMFRSAKGLEEAAAKKVLAEKSAAITNSVLNTGVGAGVQVGQEALGEEPIDWNKVGIAALGGALGQKETGLGRGLTRIGEIPASAATKAAVNALRRPGEATPEVTPDVVPKAPETAPMQDVAAPSSSMDTQAMLNSVMKRDEAMKAPIPKTEEPVPIVEAQITPIAETPIIKKSDEAVQNIPKFEPISEPVNTLTSKEEPPVTKTKVEPIKPIELTERIKDPSVQESLKRYADEAGWAQKGGGILREVADDYSSPVVGRTTWIPNKPWWSDRPVALKGDMNGAATKKAINKAYRGEKLSPNERKMVEYLVKLHDNDMVEGDIIRAEMEARDREVAEFQKQFETPETPEQTIARTTEEQARIKAQEDAKAQAEMDALAEKSRKEIAQRSQEQSGNFKLGQTPEESLTGQRRLGDQDADIPFDFQKETAQATPEQVEKAQSVINRLPGADMPWQEGDLGLIKGYGNRTGNVIYTAYKDGTGWQLPIDKLSDADFRKMGFTAAEQKKLLDARNKLEKQAEDLHTKKPFLKFEKDVEFSPDIPPNLKKVVEGWKNLLGIKQKIYFTTLEHASANKDSFTGPHRPIGAASSMPNDGGFTAALVDGNRVIAFKKNASIIKNLEVIAHELGHTHMHEVFVNAPKDVQDALKAEHLKWANSIKGTTPAKDLIQGLRARKTGKTTELPEGLQAKNLKDVDTYWRSFKEWYADQTAKWATTNEKPLSVVEKFFSKLGKSLKTFYSKLTNSGYLPNETFKKYIDSQTSKLDLEPVTEKQARVPSQEEQMQLFSKGAAEAAEAAPPKPPVTARNLAGENIGPSFPTPAVTRFSEFTRLFQNKHVDLKRTVEAIKKNFGELAEQWDPYLKEGLFHSKVADRSRLFLDKEVDPLVKKMDKLKVSNEELHNYLLNRHAEEFNKKMNGLNPDITDEFGNTVPYKLKDKASSIHTEDARKYLSGLEENKKAALESLAKDVDKMIKETQDLLVKSGYETQETIDSWNTAYEHYAPLFREMEQNKISTLSKKGMGTSGPFSKRAMGSEREVADIMNSIIGQREKAIEIAEKMEVDHALFGMFLKHPNPEIAIPVSPKAIKNPELLARELDALGLEGKDIAGMMEERKTRTLEIDPTTGLERVVYKTNPLERYKDNVLPVRINGEDSFIFFNKNNPLSANMVTALRNMDTPTIGLFGKEVGKATQWMAKVNTQWNPVFGALNFTRDFSAAMANLSTTELAGQQAKVAGGIKSAMGTIWQTMRNGDYPDTELGRLYKEFREHGGQTLYREQLARRSDQENVINERIKALNNNVAKKMASGFFKGLSDFNDSIENAIRLSAYKAAKEKGLSPEKAATIAKELTVNFDRKGAYGQAINNYFAFFNAASQGVARMTQTLKGPAGKKIMLGGVGLGAMQAGMMEMAGFGDNDPPEFVKSRNFIIPTPDGKYLAIPYPLGLHFLPNMGRIAVEAGLHGDLDKKALNMGAVIADAFNPLGGGQLSLQTVAPTVLDPAVALATNQDPFGRPISKQDRATAPTPGFSRSRDQSSEINKKVAEAINYVTGGTEDTKGLLSPTADQLDYLVGQVTGGVGREAMKVGKVTTAVAKGETDQLASYDIPLAGRFYGDIASPAANSQHFYDNVTRLAEYENTIKGMRERKENVAEFLRDNPEARLWQQANNVENQISQINKQRTKFRELGYDDDKIKMLDDRKQALMTRFNEKVNALKE